MKKKLTNPNWLNLPLWLLIAGMLTGCSKDDGLTQKLSERTVLDQQSDPQGPGKQILKTELGLPAGFIEYIGIDSDFNGTKDLLVVNFHSAVNWKITKIHLFLGKTIDEMPLTKAGNVMLNLFPFQSPPSSGVNDYSFRIPFSELGYSCDGGPVAYKVVAHAMVRLEGQGTGGNVSRADDSWGDGWIINPGNPNAKALMNMLYLDCNEVIDEYESI